MPRVNKKNEKMKKNHKINIEIHKMYVILLYHEMNF